MLRRLNYDIIARLNAYIYFDTRAVVVGEREEENPLKTIRVSGRPA